MLFAVEMCISSQSIVCALSFLLTAGHPISSTSLATQFIDRTKCDQKQKCPPSAFKIFGGGLTYKFVMETVRPNLMQMCIDGGAAESEVQFE